MSRLVALLCGINVGQARRVPIAALRALLADLGYTHIATLLNSGQAVFSAAKGSPARHAAEITAGLLRKLQVDVPVIVKSVDELAAIVAANRLAQEATDPSRLLVVFVQDPKSLTSLAPLAKLVRAPDQFHLGRQAAYLHCPQGLLKSTAGEALLGKVGRAATTRNGATPPQAARLGQGEGAVSQGMKS